MTKKVALLVRLEAKPGKENEVADFLRSGLPLVQEEPDTRTWYGVQFGPSSFGISTHPKLKNVGCQVIKPVLTSSLVK